MEMKTCGCCKVCKPKTDFSVKNRQTGLLQSKCKECTRSYSKSRYAGNKQDYVDRSAVRKKVVRASFVAQRDAYLAGCTCSKCGGTSQLQLVGKGSGKSVHEVIGGALSQEEFELALRDSFVRCLPCNGLEFGAEQGAVGGIIKANRLQLEALISLEEVAEA
ncbi:MULTISPECIES: hypothetical protein [unclassified Variovorax]|nr:MULTISPECIES: hypothetical protein [unclassified Variovorax]VTU42965.1 hypothetical protein SRS16P1_00403 [Variovorax sp. SRS16]VTU42996.1 hypothetical protein E5P1_00401 [Variovorax sp. PBL-E5]VTU43550.1 hypothetical protein H6P1_00503 [Variovorax sp. PBL-H6]